MAVAVGVVAVLTAGCGSSGFSRGEVEDLWISTMMSRYDLSEELASCIVVGFFSTLDDEELRPLTKGAELTQAQEAAIGGVAAGCGAGLGSAPD